MRQFASQKRFKRLLVLIRVIESRDLSAKVRVWCTRFHAADHFSTDRSLYFIKHLGVVRRAAIGDKQVQVQCERPANGFCA